MTKKEQNIDSDLFSYWENIFKNAPPRSRLRTQAREEMAKLAATFDQWFIVYHHSPYSSQTRKQAKEQMTRLKK